MLYQELCKELRRWPQLCMVGIVIYPGFDCGSNGLVRIERGASCSTAHRTSPRREGTPPGDPFGRWEPPSYLVTRCSEKNNKSPHLLVFSWKIVKPCGDQTIPNPRNLQAVLLVNGQAPTCTGWFLARPLCQKLSSAFYRFVGPTRKQKTHTHTCCNQKVIKHPIPPVSTKS